jgi:hypothetical protein
MLEIVVDQWLSEKAALAYVGKRRPRLVFVSQSCCHKPSSLSPSDETRHPRPMKLAESVAPVRSRVPSPQDNEEQNGRQRRSKLPGKLAGHSKMVIWM